MKKYKKKNKLDKSQPFDAWWRSTLPEVKDAADFLIRKLPPQELEKFKMHKVREHLKVILTNLNVVNKQDKRRYIAISMTKGDYHQPKRLKKLFLKYEIVKFIICFLRDNGYITYDRGFKDGNVSRYTRIKCEKKLTSLFRKFRRPGGKNLRINLPVELRDENKNIIPFDINTLPVKNIIQGVNRINKCISSHQIGCVFSNTWEWLDYMTNYKRLEVYDRYHRIFNNNDFKQGGRFYGHWSEMIKSEESVN